MGCWRRMNYLARDTLFRFAPFGWLIAIGGRDPDRPRRHRPGRDQGVAEAAETGGNGADFPRGNADARRADRPPSARGSPHWRSARAPPFCRWPWRARFRPGRVGGNGPARAGSASITGFRSCPAEIAGRDERELLAEVERRVRECHAEVRQTQTVEQRLRIAGEERIGHGACLSSRAHRVEHDCTDRPIRRWPRGPASSGSLFRTAPIPLSPQPGKSDRTHSCRPRPSTDGPFAAGPPNRRRSSSPNKVAVRSGISSTNICDNLVEIGITPQDASKCIPRSQLSVT